MRVLLMFLITAIYAGCGHMDLFVRDELAGSKPEKILLGEFSTRDMSYDPFLADELRESVRFEFFRRGYDVQLWKRDESDKKRYDTQGDAAALCAGAGADLLITGVISRKESGSFADRMVYLSITFVIRNKSGKVTGEGVCRESNVDEPVFVKDAAKAFVSEFISRVSDK